MAWFRVDHPMKGPCAKGTWRKWKRKERHPDNTGIRIKIKIKLRIQISLSGLLSILFLSVPKKIEKPSRSSLHVAKAPLTAKLL